MLLKMCARCKTPIVYPATYCERCKEIVDKEKEERLETAKKQYNKRYNKTKGQRNDYKIPVPDRRRRAHSR